MFVMMFATSQQLACELAEDFPQMRKSFLENNQMESSDSY
jgi:hypothetical protein